MGIIIEEIKNYDPYTDKFIKNTTTSRLEVGTDGSVHNLSLSSSYGLYAKNQEEPDKCDYIVYTKDEVIAMFTELQSEIEELDTPSNGDAYMTCSDIIQEKINSLRGIKDGSN